MNSDPAEPVWDPSRPSCRAAPPSCLSRGKRLLHSFLQGLNVGLGDGTDARHEVAMQLLSSEWDYVWTLNQLKEQYKMPAAHHTTAEPP